MNIINKISNKEIYSLFFFFFFIYFYLFLFLNFFENYYIIAFTDHDEGYLLEQLLLKLNYFDLEKFISLDTAYGAEYYYLSYFFRAGSSV